MKYYCLFISILIAASCSANEGLSYKNVYRAINLLKSREFNGRQFVPSYVKPLKKIDLNEANFRIESPDGTIEPLRFENLRNIPVDKLHHEDLDFLEEGFTLRVWMPKDLKKYSEWFLKHDCPQGAFDLRFSRVIIRSESIEDRREEYRNKAEQGGAPNR